MLKSPLAKLGHIFRRASSAAHAEKAPKRVVVIDPGCTEPFGHHPALNQLFVDYCQERQIPSCILATKKCNPSVIEKLNAQPVLSPNIYVRVPNDAAKASQELEARNALIEQDLASSGLELLEGDCVILHTANQWHLHGVYKWAKAFSGRGIRFRIVLRFPSFFSALQPKVSEESNEVVYQAYQKAMADWFSLDADVNFLADTPALVRFYEKLSGRPIGRVPISIDFGGFNVHANTRRAVHSEPVFLFAGNGRKEKGIELLPNAIEKFYERGGQGKFIIQSINLATDDVENHLRKISPQVDIIGRPFAGDDYFNLLQSGDVILVPYDPDRYNLRTSHIFTEALGVGRPVITTGNTWMEEELGQLSKPCGVLMPHYTSDSLTEALFTFSQDAQGLFDNAMMLADSVREEHNAQAFLRALLT